MAINAFTLNNLYNQGILDYVPYDLVEGSGLSTLSAGQNPYLNTAMQGQLYQNHGQANDSFMRAPNNNPNVEIGSQSNGGVNGFGLDGIGSQSNAGLNGFGLNGVGSQSNAGLNGFGLNGVGSQSNAGLNGFGLDGIGSQSNAGLNGFGIGGIGTESQGGMNGLGGFGEVKGGLNKVSAIYNNTPNYVKGIVAGVIALGTTVFCIKKCGAKLNPANWFRKK